MNVTVSPQRRVGRPRPAGSHREPDPDVCLGRPLRSHCRPLRRLAHAARQQGQAVAGAIEIGAQPGACWLDGRSWGDRETEYTRPHIPDREARAADVPLAELGLKVGATIADIFDYGDEWRVEVTLREPLDGDGGPYPRIFASEGIAPPRYPPLKEE